MKELARSLPLTVIVILICLEPAGSARAQEMPQDEPGVSDPAAPPASTGQPAAPPAQPLSGEVAPSRLECTSGGAEEDLLARVEQTCVAGVNCPVLPEVICLLASPRHGARAAKVLGSIGDRRSVMPLVQSVVYGVTAEIRAAALRALKRVAGRSPTREVAEQLAEIEADPAVRKALAVALGRTPDTDTGTAAEGKAKAAKSEFGFYDADPTRVVYGPTGFSREAGTWGWTIYNLALWRFDYGISDNVEIALITAPPVMIVAAMPQIKVTLPLGENARIGIQATGGVIYPYVNNEDGIHFAAYGGGPVVSIGNPDLFVNIGVAVYGLTVADDRDRNSAWMVLPNLGFGWRFSKRLKLNVELYAPLLEEIDFNGELWALMYGLRIFGEKIYGDVSFVLPFFPDSWEVMKYMPIGAPLLSFGFLW